MNSLKSLQLLCQDTYTKCFGFLNSKSTKLYEQVDTNQAKNAEEEEQTDKGAEWSTQDSIAQSQGSLSDTPPKKGKKKIVLIGNMDEDSGVRKEEAEIGNDEDLFSDIEKPSFNQKIQTNTKNVKKVVKSSKSQTEAPKTNKFSMDDELQVESGWGEMEANI